MTEQQAYELIENYLHGNMPDNEVIEFEHLMLTDPILAERAKQYNELTGSLQLYGQRTRMQRRLNELHRQIEADRAAMPKNMPGSLQKPAQTPVYRKMWQKQWPSMAVAASVAVLLTVGTLAGLGVFRSKDAPHHAQYRELRREMEQIMRTQNNLMNDISRVEEKMPNTPSLFSGTGFAISADGYVVTSFHVVRGAKTIVIEGNNGHRYRAEHVYSDTANDISILKVADQNFTTFGKLPYSFKSTEADLGEKVYTLGYPREDVVYGEGSLSALSGFQGDSNAYQVSIPVNPGNSGGPLLDDRGNLIGIISGTQTETQGAAFAIKSSYLGNLIQTLSKDSLQNPIKISRSNYLAGNHRPYQLKKLKDFVFVVKVYN